MLLSNAWTLPLLFLIFGAASRFLLAKSGGARYFASGRSSRLLWPLLCAVVVVVPPKAWIDVVVNPGYGRSFLAFWTSDYWRFNRSFGVIMPAYNLVELRLSEFVSSA